MKRVEIEQRVKGIPDELKTKVEKAALVATLVGFAAGIVVATFTKLAITLLLLAVGIVGVLWLLGEAEDAVFTDEDSKKEPTPPHTNGNSASSQDEARQ